METNCFRTFLRRGPIQRLLLRKGPAFSSPFQTKKFFSTGPSQDPYKTLGLHRTASAAEVKSRYRELALQHHPDLNKDDPKCAHKMAAITDAYALLTDLKRRKEWDAANGGQTTSSSGSTTGGASMSGSNEWMDASQMYSEFNNVFGKMAGRMSQKGQGPQAQRGEDASVDLDVPFLEAMRGCRKKLSLKLKQPCRDCGSSGAQNGTGWCRCPACNGTGVRRVERGIMSMGMPCSRCNGVGELLEFPCHTCKGDGIEGSRLSEVWAEVPAGIKSSMELRLPGHGHAGLRGGKRGHLFVTVRVGAHDKFRHVEDDLHVDVDMSLKELLLGGVKKVPTLGNS